MSKSSAMPQAVSGISLPRLFPENELVQLSLTITYSKQDIFVGFATVPGFVSFTSALGSPYLQVSHVHHLRDIFILFLGTG